MFSSFNFHVKTKFSSFITSFASLDLCRKSSISSLAKIHGRNWAAIEANSLQCRAVGELVQRSDVATVSRQEKVKEAVSGGAREDRITIRSCKYKILDLCESKAHAMHQQVLRNVPQIPWKFRNEKIISRVRAQVCLFDDLWTDTLEPRTHEEIEFSPDDAADLIYIFSNLTHVSAFFFHLFSLKTSKKWMRIFYDFSFSGVNRKDSTDFDLFLINDSSGLKSLEKFWLDFRTELDIIIRPRQFSIFTVESECRESYSAF